MKREDAVVASIWERRAAVTAELARILAKDSRQKAARDILSQFPDVIDRTNKELQRRTSLEEPPSSFELQLLVEPIVFMHDFLELFDKTDSSRVPFELLHSFQRLLSELSGQEEGVSIIFKPIHSYNYSLMDLRQEFERAGPLWSRAAAVKPRPFLVTFPSAEAGSALLHTLLYHEIGHAYYEARGIGRAMAQHIDDAGRPPPLAGTDSERSLPSDKDLAGARTILTNWMEEIACDLFAFRLAGPAFVCAFRFFFDPFLFEAALARTNADGTRRTRATHPDSRTRARAMTWYAKSLSEAMPELAETCRLFGTFADLGDLESRDNDRADPPGRAEQLAEAWLTDNPGLLSELAARMAECPSPFRHAGIAKRIQQATEQIAHKVPPVARPGDEVRTLDEVLAIAFCAAWLFRIRGSGKWGTPSPAGCAWDDEDARAALSQMLLAGVEAGELELRHRLRNQDQTGGIRVQRSPAPRADER